MVKLIASDLDGTLLQNYQQSVPEDLLNTIKELKEKHGIIFVAASGRQYANIERMFSPLGYDIPLISENGSICAYKGEMLSTGEIPVETLHHIIDGFIEYRERFHGGNIILSVKETYYTDSTDDRFIDHMINKTHNHLTYVPDLYAIKDKILKAAICDFNGTQNLEPFFHEKVGHEIRVAKSATHWIDFIAPNANKGYALSVLLDKFNIKKEECICFGDQQNDIDMLKHAGTSYVMSHGAPEALAIADHVIDDVLPVLQSLL